MPRPYVAALAICSDLDETPDAETYFELMRFLNTTAPTSMGAGVGLEVANSIYFDMAPGKFSYWNTDEENREKIRVLIRSGHIDCLHSYGDTATSRQDAVRALEELEKHGCRLPVWVDHSKAPSNFGRDIMMGHGDEPGHPVCHVDLTLKHGIRYFWRGRVTSVVGQDQPVGLIALPRALHPQASVKTIAKEASKQVLARCGSGKYRLHGANRVLNPIRLRGGEREVFEFLRCNPHPAGVDHGDTAAGVAEVLTEPFLDLLVERRGLCVLYTHLGKLDGGKAFSQSTVDAFRRLARYQDAGKILVTTTYRLLSSLAGQNSSVENASWHRLSYPFSQ